MSMARGEDKAAKPSPSKTYGGKIGETEPSTVARGKAAESEIGKKPSTVAREETVNEEENTEEDLNYFPGIAVELGHGGTIGVLFETPSGFAIFSYDGVKLFLPNAVEHIWTQFIQYKRAKRVVWLREFQIFEDKDRAINTNTGVDARLASMIKGCLEPEQKLAVGSSEYAQIIEENMGISCLYSDAVMELMWGLKNCLNSLVPGELIKGDRPVCKGMRSVLDKYGFDYKPEMVNDDLIEVVCVVYNCDYSVKMHFGTLHRAGKQLMNISEIDSKDWDLLKLATALMWVCYPEEKLVIDPRKILSEDECTRLERDAPRYKDKLWKRAVLQVYNQILQARKIRHKWLSRLNYFLKEAEEECKAEQVMSSADPVH